MQPLQATRAVFAVLSGCCIVYSVLTIGYVASTPDLHIRCLLTNDFSASESGLQIRSSEGIGPCKGETPAAGDFLIRVAGHRIQSFHDYSQAIVDLRTRSLEPGATLTAGSDPSESLDPKSTLTLVHVEDGGRYVKVWFLRPETGALLTGWVPLQPQPFAPLLLSIVWFVLQLVVTLVAAVAFWQRPYDRSTRTFLLMSLVAMVAFIGGSHWWVIFGNLWLLTCFATAAILLPAVLLHFFLVFPSPRGIMLRAPRLVLTGIYFLPLLVAIAAVTVSGLSFWLSQDFGAGPLAETLERALVAKFSRVLPSVGFGINLYLAVSAVYFLFAVVALIQSYSKSQRRYEHEQVRWILLAALAATLPLGFALGLAYVRPTEFAFGANQVPLFLASLLFTIAYAIGVVRYRLMLINQVLSRGVVYYCVTWAISLLFSILVTFGALALIRRDAGMLGQPLLMFVILVVAVMMLLWLRDRLQGSVDREFFREKYPLDKALRRMNQAVSGLLDRQTLADRMLDSCREVLQADRGAIYLRSGETREFRLLSSSGGASFPTRIETTRDFVETLTSGLSLQRIRSGTSPVQQQMRSLDAELIHGLDVDGKLAGLVVLGGKLEGTGYNAEDVSFLTAMSRIAGVTLHFGRVHEDLSRLNQDLAQLNDELESRTTHLAQLTADLHARDDEIEQQQRRIEVLERQLRMRDRTAESVEPREHQFTAPRILGKSPAIQVVLETVRKTAPTDASVLIRGESGTGKELLTRAIHENSSRRNGPLVTIHCAALAPGVLESELFGHVRGAFTDARQDKIGRFQMADGGTLFLDEIGDVPLETQVKLLRVLQERMIEPVGSGRSIPVDVRLIAATHRNLEQFIREGRFREDLYYRLNVISVQLPPLRERGDDIVELAFHFLKVATERTGKQVSHFGEDAIEALLAYDWPGNIRELENVVERAVVLAEGEQITAADLPASVRTGEVEQQREAPGRSLRSTPPSLARDLDPSALPQNEIDPALAVAMAGTTPLVAGSDDERELLLHALRQCGGNKARAARLLGMPRSTYFSKLKKHGLD